MSNFCLLILNLKFASLEKEELDTLRSSTNSSWKYDNQSALPTSGDNRCRFVKSQDLEHQPWIKSVPRGVADFDNVLPVVSSGHI